MMRPARAVPIPLFRSRVVPAPIGPTPVGPTPMGIAPTRAGA